MSMCTNKQHREREKPVLFFFRNEIFTSIDGYRKKIEKKKQKSFHQHQLKKACDWRANEKFRFIDPETEL